MATVQELKAAAKDAGLTGYSSKNKDQLKAMLAGAGISVADAEEAATKDTSDLAIGQPTEPEKANLTEQEEKGLKLLKVGGRETRTASSKAGIPTEPDRGGVNAKDWHVLNPKAKEAKGAHEPAEKPKAKEQPSITGNSGAPTEPDRGGVNELERKLAGVK